MEEIEIVSQTKQTKKRGLIIASSQIGYGNGKGWMGMSGTSSLLHSSISINYIQSSNTWMDEWVGNADAAKGFPVEL
jgi:hypothetical protein